MTPTERLQAAIDRLTELRDTATEGPWEVDGDGKVWAHPVDPDGARITHLDDVCDPASLNDADLIVTLHRTIDAQIGVLRSSIEWFEKGEAEWSEPIWARHPEMRDALKDLLLQELALADAILGAAS